jgi:hypothetical protein
VRLEVLRRERWASSWLVSSGLAIREAPGRGDRS